MANPSWVKGGASPNPKGRPPKARELALLAIAHEVVNAQNFRQVVTTRLLDALGKKQGKGLDGKPMLIDDPESTAQGRNQAAIWIRDTLVGKPTEFVNLNTDDSAYDQMGAYTTEELEAIYAAISRLRPDEGSESPDTDGVGTTPSHGAPQV